MPRLASLAARSVRARAGRWSLPVLAAAAAAAAGGLGAQGVDAPVPGAALPFSVGERLTFRARVAKAAATGRGAMWVEGPADVRGTSTWLLRFDFKAGLGPVRAVDRTSSWLDARRMAALRFVKHERHPLSSSDESVEMYPDERRWRTAEGGGGESPSARPLDELSFLYFLRTLPLDADTALRFDRHYAAARNPTTVRLLGRDTVETGAGRFRTLVVEMRVRDERRYRGEGVLRIHFTDDACRLPARIESSVPVFGAAVLTLESHSYPEGRCTGWVR